MKRSREPIPGSSVFHITANQNILLQQIVSRIVNNTDTTKYRQISTTSKKLMSTLGSQSTQIMLTLGFELTGEVWFYPPEKNGNDLKRLETNLSSFQVTESAKRSKTTSASSSSSSSLNTSTPATTAHQRLSTMVYCDKCDKTRFLFENEFDPKSISDINAEWNCAMLFHRMPEGCKEPDDELKQIVGRSYAAIFQLRLGIQNRRDLAGANVAALVDAAGGDEFYSLINGWVLDAQKMELDDCMLSVFDNSEDLRLLFMAICVSSPVDLMEQTSETWLRLLESRCGISNISTEDIDRFRNKSSEVLKEQGWMNKWSYSVVQHREEEEEMGETPTSSTSSSSSSGQ